MNIQRNISSLFIFISFCQLSFCQWQWQIVKRIFKLEFFISINYVSKFQHITVGFHASAFIGVSVVTSRSHRLDRFMVPSLWTSEEMVHK